jgi:hypothetical protein
MECPGKPLRADPQSPAPIPDPWCEKKLVVEPECKHVRKTRSTDALQFAFYALLLSF